MAGIAAGREGTTTFIVEHLGYLGGAQTGALVTPMMPNQIRGVPLNALGESGVWQDGNRGWFNPEAAKGVLEQMAVEARAELLYYTFVEDAVMEGNRRHRSFPPDTGTGESASDHRAIPSVLSPLYPRM